MGTPDEVPGRPRDGTRQGRILGVAGAASVTEDRVRNVRRAERVIRAAQGTERLFLREPDGDRLAQMLEAVTAFVDTIEGDGVRWALHTAT